MRLPDNPLKIRPVLPGPKGDRGPPGTGEGAEPFTFQQNSALQEWVVNHNLGYRPASVEVLTLGRARVFADYQHNSENQLTISFSAPFAGFALII